MSVGNADVSDGSKGGPGIKNWRILKYFITSYVK